MSLNVIQLGPVPPPEGGISRNIFAIRDAVRRRGGMCSIVATSKSSEVRSELDVYHPRSAIEMIKQIRAIDFDVLHLHVGGDLSLRVMAMAFVSTLLARRSVLTIHSGAFPDSDAGKRASKMSVRGFVIRRFDRVIAINDRLAEVFRLFGVSEARTQHILPFSLQHPDPAIVVSDDLKEFAAAHSPMLVAVGGLERDYDPLFLIAAMSGIVADHPNAGLVIVGDGSMRREVEDAVEASGYAEHIMIAGNVDHAVTLHLMKDADAVLRTTLFDGDAISVREALFLGTPVITTDNGMRPEGVHLIAIGDKVGLVKTVSDLAMTQKETPTHTDEAADNIAAILKVYADLITEK